MSKQVQDAYIVAATRTPIGRSGRGYFRNTRPDDLLVAAVKNALRRCQRSTPRPSRTPSSAAASPKASRA
jgi:acetyl-CoA acyltransferase